MGALFSLRDAQPSDMEHLDYFASLEGMDALPGCERIRVAVNEQDEAVGFCRLDADENGVAYVNPIVVFDTWRGYGVGRALIEDAWSREGELRLVARGQSVGFYEKLGFKPLSWDEVDLKAASEDCDNCPVREECGPLPMRLA